MKSFLKKNVRTLKNVALSGLAAILINGCATSNAPRNEIWLSSPITKSEKKSGEIINLIPYSIHQDEESGTISVNGQIKVSYTEEIWTEQTRHSQKVGYSTLPPGSVWLTPFPRRYVEKSTSIIRSSKETLEKKFTPSLIEINIDLYRCGDLNKIVSVADDGSFQARLHHNSLKIPKEKSYYKIQSYNPMIEIRVGTDDPNNISGPTSIYPKKLNNITKEYFSEQDADAIKKFVDLQWVNMIISLKDKMTRETIQASIERKTVHAPDYDRILREEFGDEEVYNRAKRFDGNRHIPQQGEKSSKNSSVLYLEAIQGTKYEIQTINANYHHTKNIITAEREHPNQTILLVEVGEKIRVDSSKEGGQVVIDDD